MISLAWTRWRSASERFTIRDAVGAITGRHGKWASWLVPLTYIGCLLAFLTDLRSTNALAFGVFYTPLVATAVFHRDRGAVWVLAATAGVLDIVGAIFPHIAHNTGELAINRILSLSAIGATAMFVWQARSIQDRLTAQTSRAETAERLKTDVLTNLSHDIRAPLYSMMGVLELIAAEGRPEQKAALGMVRTAGRRLVTTVDNLVDLTQMDREPLPAEAIDLGMLLRQTAEACRADAEARQIRLRIDIPKASTSIAQANPWAVRRILENLIGDAITYTAPGGHIDVKTLTEPGMAVALITDSGTRPFSAILTATHSDLVPMRPSVMGLALNQRLANAIGARLLFNSVSGEETAARLELPVI